YSGSRPRGPVSFSRARPRCLGQATLVRRATTPSWAPLPRWLPEQLGQRYAQDPRDQPQVEDGDVPLTALDRADERAVQVALLGELGLGVALRDSPLADVEAQVLEKSDVVEVHT